MDVNLDFVDSMIIHYCVRMSVQGWSLFSKFYNKLGIKNVISDQTKSVYFLRKNILSCTVSYRSGDSSLRK